MAVSFGGKHRARRLARSARRARLAARSDRQRRSATRAGALVATAVVGAAILGAAPAKPATTSLPGPVRHDVALTDFTGTTTPTPTFDDSLKWLLDSLGVGAKTIPQILAPGNDTVGDLLGVSGVDTSLNIASTLDMLGLQNITVSQVMSALNLPATETVDQALSQIQLLNTRLDTILTPLGMPSTQTLFGLEQRFSIANITVDQLLPKLGFNGQEGLLPALQHIGLGGFASMIEFISLAACGSSWSDSTPLDTVMSCVVAKQSPYPNYQLTGSSTLGGVLQNIHQVDQNGNALPALVGQYTIGQALNFGPNTTIRQFVDNLMVNLNVTSTSNDPTYSGTLVPLGSQTLGSIMSWLNVPPNESLATLLDNMLVNNVPLGTYTIGDALDGLVVDPAALSTQHVLDSTPLVDLFTAMGFGTLTVDQLLNLSP